MSQAQQFTLKAGMACLLLQFTTTSSFAVLSSCTKRVWSLSALTERQMQFWEDVEDGLTDLESFWAKQGLDVDRIRTFAKRARGELPSPEPSGASHEPSEEHVDGLTSRPFWDLADDQEAFPWAGKLEANADIIQREYDARLKESSAFTSDSVWQNQVMGSGWSAIRLQRLGVWNTETCQEFPETFKLLKSLKIPLAVRGVCFAKQNPGSGVQPHSDGRNFILTSHLGLKVPDGCVIEVGGLQRGWDEGKLTTLDTSYIHSTSNPTDDERHVLIIDFWHPELTESERSALEFIYDLRNKFESGQVPIRKPRSMQEEDVGLGALWKSLTGGNG
jgi:hypothetical protein